MATKTKITVHRASKSSGIQTKNINMLQDDSNGETFEIIDKKPEELTLGADRAG